MGSGKKGEAAHLDSLTTRFLVGGRLLHGFGFAFGFSGCWGRLIDWSVSLMDEIEYLEPGDSRLAFAEYLRARIRAGEQYPEAHGSIFRAGWVQGLESVRERLHELGKLDCLDEFDDVIDKLIALDQ